MKQDLKNNPGIKLGNVELPDGFDDLENEKLRITAWIDGDIYNELKRRADAGEANGKYQTLMNELLREKLFENAASSQEEEEEEAELPSHVVTQIKKLLKQSTLSMEKQLSRKMDQKFYEFKRANPKIMRSSSFATKTAKKRSATK